jgi:hypothetical protein
LKTVLKKIAIAGLTTLTLGVSVAATVTEADAQVARGERYDQGYRNDDPGFMGPVATVVGSALAAPATVAGAFAGTGYTPMAGPNFGYQHWPYGNGYRGGFLNSGSDMYGY